tara:strand:+ start:2462 stop:2725 length:264 start_codon:yes stop_codon:yes gene_type:complete
MGNFTQELTKDIKKIVGTLKSEEILVETLKKKLTKKEFKYFKLKMQNASEEVIAKKLACDKDRLKAIKKQTGVKLNQEKLKKELLIV